MNVFVLCTGRCGSMTFAKACGHITNYSAGHETGLARLGLNYPERHIEVDNRLAWFLGRLDQGYPRALYVHLTRDPARVAESYARRWGRARTLIAGYGTHILRIRDPNPLAIATDMVHTITYNIRGFLATQPPEKQRAVRLEHAYADFGAFWDWIGAQGDKQAALAEFEVKHNAD